MFGRLLRSAWFSLPCKDFAGSASEAATVSPAAAQMEIALAKRKAERLANRERAERAETARLRRQLARDPLINGKF